MAEFSWREFLEQLNRVLLQDADVVEQLSSDIVAAGWLGCPSATDTQIMEAEGRLGTILPPSYRDFLKVSNGWRRPTWFIPRLWSTEEIEWFSVKHQHWIDVLTKDPFPVPDADYFLYGERQSTLNYRVEYLRTALEISARGDGAIFLLNPRVVTEEGEWEAWLLSNKAPGAERFRSFREMMQGQYERLT